MWPKPLGKAKAKYGQKKVLLSGHSFASKLEANVYLILKAREQTEGIKLIQVQDSVYLTDARILYKPDFKCEDKDGNAFWVEAKGFETAVWRIKRKLWMHYGPGPIEIWMGSHLKAFLNETIIPKES